MKQLGITLNGDGSISIDARKMPGKAEEILRELRDLAGTVGGDLTVEKHVHGAHDHVGEHHHDHA